MAAEVKSVLLTAVVFVLLLAAACGASDASVPATQSAVSTVSSPAPPSLTGRALYEALHSSSFPRAELPPGVPAFSLSPSSENFPWNENNGGVVFFGAASADLSRIYGAGLFVLASDRDVQQVRKSVIESPGGVDVANRFVPTDSLKAECFVGFHKSSGYSETFCATSVGSVMVTAGASLKGSPAVRDDTAMALLKLAVLHLANVRDANSSSQPGGTADWKAFEVAQYTGRAPVGWTVKTYTIAEFTRLAQEAKPLVPTKVAGLIPTAVSGKEIVLVVGSESGGQIVVSPCGGYATTAEGAASLKSLGIASAPAGEITYQSKRFASVRFTAATGTESYEAVVGDEDCHLSTVYTTLGPSADAFGVFANFLSDLKVARVK